MLLSMEFGTLVGVGLAVLLLFVVWYAVHRVFGLLRQSLERRQDSTPDDPDSLA